MHIAQNFISVLNNQHEPYRCYSFFPDKVSSQDLGLVTSFNVDRSLQPQKQLLSHQYVIAVSVLRSKAR